LLKIKIKLDILQNGVVYISLVQNAYDL